MLECKSLEPARLTLGGGYASRVEPGGVVAYNATVFNAGEKSAVDIELRKVVAGPCTARSRSKARARCVILEGRDQWSATLTCGVKRGAKPGRYPLLIRLTARNVPREHSTVSYDVRPMAGQG